MADADSISARPDPGGPSPEPGQAGQDAQQRASTAPATPLPTLPTLRTTLLSLSLFLLVVGTFLPAVHNDFVGFDDPDYVTANLHVQRGLTWETVLWAFGSTAA